MERAVSKDARKITAETSPSPSEEAPFQILAPDGRMTARTELGLSLETVVQAYRNMVLTRTLDSRMNALQRQGRMGTYVSCAGQEASQVGAVLALSKKDWVFPMYRDLGIVVQMGVPLDSLMNRLFANAQDESLGRDLPNAYGWRKYRIFSLAAPIASHVCPSVGFAMAAKMRKDDLVALSTFGDGATSSSEFHVSLNFAGVYKAPAIFLCENNQYAISVPLKLQTASESIAVKARAYGFDGVRVDGNDLFAVYNAVKGAVEKARRGEGPSLIECFTYRLGAHSTSDDWKKYRSVDEVQQWEQKDPLLRIRSYLETKEAWSKEKEEKLKQETEAMINAEITRAESTSPPPIESMFEDVYATKDWNLTEQRENCVQQ